MLQEVSSVIKKAKSYGLVTVVWCYPRGGDLKKKDETALDVISYSAHIACLIGADIIKVKPPADYCLKNKELFFSTSELSERVKAIKRSCFDGKRPLCFYDSYFNLK